MFIDKGETVNIPEERWMKIELRSDWEFLMANLLNKKFLLSKRDQAVVDKLHEQLKA